MTYASREQQLSAQRLWYHIKGGKQRRDAANKIKHPGPVGRPITSKHPRAAYWREYKRKKYAQRKATSTEGHCREAEAP